MNATLFHLGTYGVRVDDLWIIGTAALCCVLCGVLGCFLVLRRLSLLGDAISHAILPGIAVAFMLSGTRDLLPMLAGAAAAGLATAAGSSALARMGRVQEDAAMGVVFTTMFAVGVVLITWVARDIDLDPGCVLYGLLEFTPFDTLPVAGIALPRAFVGLAVATVLALALVAAFYKELKIVCFDPALATTLGISAALVHNALIAGVAVATVVSFEAVGSILVVAMLVGPGATAHLLTDRLSRTLWLAALVGLLSAVLGYILAVRLNTSVAGMIATVSVGLFVLAALAAPRHGLLAREARRALLALRIAREDALAMLYRWHEQADVPGAAAPRPLTRAHLRAALGRGPLSDLALFSLARRGLIAAPANAPRSTLALTPAGLDAARPLVRGHRLWESYLARHLGIPLDHLHAGAHRTEHYLAPDLRERLTGDAPPTDPHGRPIPPAGV